ncbi:MAG TPA: PDZ domain-containing protein [Phycisphaerae bacterium]|nr:PDZ domain-containing protein [Phycisphaerae bacterium]
MISLPLTWILTFTLTLPALAAGGKDCALLAAAGDPANPSDEYSIVWLAADDQASAGQAPKMIVRKLDEDDEDVAPVGNIEPGGPWLGIQFGPVPKPLASHLKIEGEAGQMVLNVAEGSPADTAGLQQFDVITQIDGQQASADIGDFLERVRAFTPNEVHTFSLLRGGQSQQVQVTVGTRPDDFESLEYKYETPMEDLAHGKVFGRGGMLEKDDQGNWVFKGLNMKDLPDAFHAIPDVGDMDFQFNFPIPGPDGGDGQQVYVFKNKGETLNIVREQDGRITVTRTKIEDGKKDTTTTTYENEDDLKARDPDAHKSMSHGPAKFGPRKFKFYQDGQWQDALKNSEEAMKHYEDAIRQFHDGKGGFAFGFHKPSTSFETTPDGKIRVTIRKGDDELVENYDSAEALRSANPNLFKKYQKFQEKSETP